MKTGQFRPLAASIAATALTLAPAPVAAQVAGNQTGNQAVWMIPETTPCVGLTARWSVSADELDRLLAPGLAPATGPDGNGTLLLFAASCPASTIDGAETGPVSTAHVLIPLAGSRNLPTVPTVDEDGWLAVPWSIGPLGNTVTDLFGRFAFATSPGEVSFTWHPGSDSSPAGARFKVTSDGGEIDVAAQFDSESVLWGSATGLIDARGRPTDVVFAHGPEESLRYRNGVGRVSIQGETVLSAFDLDPAAASFSLDVDFVWEFVFVSGAGR